MNALVLSLSILMVVSAVMSEQRGVTTADLNLRSGPSTSSKVLSVFNAGTTVTIASTQGKWAVITAPKKGYSALKYIRMQQSETPKAATASTSTATSASTASAVPAASSTIVASDALSYFKQAMEQDTYTGYDAAATRGSAASLNINAMLAYIEKYWDSKTRTNHDCSKGAYHCTPYMYFGSDACGYGNKLGGDCANFVSQALLAAGHPKLNKGVCRGDKHCGTEPGAEKLRNCLSTNFGWKLTDCAKDNKPPKNLEVGDIVFARYGSCSVSAHHSMVVTKIDSKGVFVSAHSSDIFNQPLERFFGGKWGYIQYALH